MVEPAPAAASEPAEAPPKEDILDLTESMAMPGSEAPSFQTIDGGTDVVFADVPPPAEPTPRAAEHRQPPAPSPQQAPQQAPLLSSATHAAVDSAFNALAQTVLVQNARTLEDLVREMLRPMLKSWLDDYLPGIVERIVRAEIERVSRGRG